MKSFIEFQKEEVELDEEQIEERNKQNAMMRKTMDASRGAKFKARNDTTTPDPEPQHKTGQAHNKAIGRAIRQMSNEEVELDEEQLDELSPKTLGSYIKKASGEATKSREAEKHWDKNDSDERGLHYANKNHAEKREKGIKTATDKSEKMADKGIRKAVGKLLNTEEVEQIDELSKDTLVSYEKKSRVAAHKHALASELKGLAADPAGSYAHKMMADKRHAGWKVAVKKLHTEESELDEEQLDELSKKTLGSYVNKAAKDTGRLGMVLHKGEWIHTVTTQPNRVKGIATAVGKLTKEESDTPFEGPYKQSKGTVTDKSGAKHTPLSNVRSLARNAIEKMKQKMRMAHLSPEVRAEKLARNEELVGGQKKLDIDKDGKIEKSDLEVLRTKKLKEEVDNDTHFNKQSKAMQDAINLHLRKGKSYNDAVAASKVHVKEDVTTAAQKLKAALDRHTEHAVAANRAGDHDAVKVHQGYANKIKTQLGKLAKNEEVDLDEDVTTAAQRLKAALDRHVAQSLEASRNDDFEKRKVHQDYIHKIKTQLGKLAKNEEVELDEEQLDEANPPANYDNRFDVSKHIYSKTGHGVYFDDTHMIDPKSNKTIIHNALGGKHTATSLAKATKHYYKKEVKNEESEIDEAGPMMDLPNPDRTDRLGVSYNPHRKVKTASDLARIAKGKTSVSKEKPGQLRKPNPPSTRKATVSSLMKMLDQMGEEVEITEASRAKLTNYISAAKSDEKKDRSVGIALAQKKKWGDEKHGTVSAKVPANEGHQVVATTKEGESFKSGIHSTKEKALSQHYKMAKTGNFKKIDTIKTEEVEITEAEMTDAEMAKRENIVKGMKKSFKDFTAKYGDRAKEVMYATATKKAMEEEVEEELEEDMDEGVTTRNGAVTVHKGTYGMSYQGDDEDDENDTPEKKEPAVKRGRGRPAGAKSGAKPKGSSAGKSYGGVALHSLRLPNNNK